MREPVGEHYPRACEVGTCEYRALRPALYDAHVLVEHPDVEHTPATSSTYQFGWRSYRDT